MIATCEQVAEAQHDRDDNDRHDDPGRDDVEPQEPVPDRRSDDDAKQPPHDRNLFGLVQRNQPCIDDVERRPSVEIECPEDCVCVIDRPAGIVKKAQQRFRDAVPRHAIDPRQNGDHFGNHLDARTELTPTVDNRPGGVSERRVVVGQVAKDDVRVEIAHCGCSAAASGQARSSSARLPGSAYRAGGLRLCVTLAMGRRSSDATPLAAFVRSIVAPTNAARKTIFCGGLGSLSLLR